MAFARAFELGQAPPDAADGKLALVASSFAAGSAALGHTSYTFDLEHGPGAGIQSPDGARVLVTWTLAEVTALCARADPLAADVRDLIDEIHPWFAAHLPRLI